MNIRGIDIRARRLSSNNLANDYQQSQNIDRGGRSANRILKRGGPDGRQSPGRAAG
jgi:hypothetical protein